MGSMLLLLDLTCPVVVMKTTLSNRIVLVVAGDCKPNINRCWYFQPLPATFHGDFPPFMTPLPEMCFEHLLVSQNITHTHVIIWNVVVSRNGNREPAPTGPVPWNRWSASLTIPQMHWRKKTIIILTDITYLC